MYNKVFCKGKKFTMIASQVSINLHQLASLFAFHAADSKYLFALPLLFIKCLETMLHLYNDSYHNSRRLKKSRWICKANKIQ